MAKSLKLNIKNSQLADILKKDKLKKEAAEEKSKDVRVSSPPKSNATKPSTEVKPVEKEVLIETKISQSEKLSSEKLSSEKPVSENPVSEKLSSEKPIEDQVTSEKPKETHPEKIDKVNVDEKRTKSTETEKKYYKKEEPFIKDLSKKAPYSRGPSSRGPSSGGPSSGGPSSRGPSSGGPSSRGPSSGGPSSKAPEKKETQKPQKDLKKSGKPGEVKPKKGLTNYKRQAFSRVFDSSAQAGDDMPWRRSRHRKKSVKKDVEPVIRPTEISVIIPITTKDLASKMKIKGSDVIQKLFMQGRTLTINDYIDDSTTIELIGMEFGCKINIDTSQEERLKITDKSVQEEILETDAKLLRPRIPVIAVMGHVDHGKTSIIDAFRKTNLVAGEAGSITQHIGAFQCKTAHGNFTVLDTPGHEAFTAIRSRGACVTDIVLLVIAGDEGIKPQTDEAIEKAQEAGAQIIVAINKSDKPGFDADNVYRQLADRNLLPEAWGGKIITVNCSAATKDGIENLAEMVSIQSDVLELKANYDCRARGTVLESGTHIGLGATVTLLVQNGTLELGDSIIFKHEYGKIKTMHNEKRELVEKAEPSHAVSVTGLSGVPSAGDEFIALESEKEARKIATDRKSTLKHTQLKQTRTRTVEGLISKQMEDQDKKTLNVIIKADVDGSVESVKSTLNNIKTDKVLIKFISSGVGQISESDIELAAASGAIIVGFHSNIERHAKSLVKKNKTVILIHNVIYHLVEDVKKYMITILDKVRQEKEVGSLKVIRIFKSSKVGIIAGSVVLDGSITRSSFVKIFRNDEAVWKGHIKSLKREQEDIKQAKKGIECGIVMDGTNDIQLDDIIKCYEISYIIQEL